MGFFSKKFKKKKASSPSTKGKNGKQPTTPETAATPTTPPTDSTMSGAPTTPSKKGKAMRTRITMTPNPPSQQEPPTTGEDTNNEGTPRLSDTARQVLDDLQTSEGDKINAIAQGESPKEEEKKEEDVNTVHDNSVIVDGATRNNQTPNDDDEEEETITRKLLDTFNRGCQVLAPEVLPGPLQAMLPAVWQKNVGEKGSIPKVSYFTESFAIEFREELHKMGFALVYHQPSFEHQGDWQGRSVTLLYKPGVCNAVEMSQPTIEWSTLGGGKQPNILTRSIELMDIISIVVSTSDDVEGKMNSNDGEDIQCFFTVTTKSGDVHVFEALSKEESHRLVIGIKNLTGRFSKLMVAGDERVLTEYFDIKSNPAELQLVTEQAMLVLSHTFLTQ